MDKATNAGRDNSPAFLSVPAAAKILGVSRMTLYRLIADGNFPHLRIRSRIVIPRRAIQNMMDAALDSHDIADAG